MLMLFEQALGADEFKTDGDMSASDRDKIRDQKKKVEQTGKIMACAIMTYLGNFTQTAQITVHAEAVGSDPAGGETGDFELEYRDVIVLPDGWKGLIAARLFTP